MKKMLTATKKKLKFMLEDESAQGATEYILLLVGVIAALAIFKQPLTDLMREQMDKISAKINGFTDFSN